MSAALRRWLTLLVLVDLLFVHITWSVGLQWLVPLYALTLAAPFLARHCEKGPYRVTWNASVFVVFGILVHDATQSGVRYMLQDGLILAAFCQVHLLNNLGRRQRPDLLFFNAFLIALVTCFFSQDLAFLGVLLVFVPLLMLGMELAHLPELPWRRLARDTALRSGTVLAVTALAFLTVPRSFQREGLLGDQLRLMASGGEVAFREEVRLGALGSVQKSDRVVLRAHLEQGNATDVSPYWRGATSADFRRGAWTPEWRRHRDRRPNADPTWWQDAPREWRRADLGQGARLRVETLDPALARIFAPLSAQRLRLHPPGDPMLVVPLRDGAVLYSRGGDTPEALRYEVELAAVPTIPLGRSPVSAATRDYVQLPRGSAPPNAARFLAEIAAGLPASISEHELVTRIRDNLAASRPYVLPGEAGAARNLTEFFARAGGHCEHFASALVILLRLRHVPCRLVTGFHASEWDATGRVLTVRSRHAHAWVEVLDPQTGWYVVDPTPARAVAPTPESWPGKLRAWAIGLWASITGFDARARELAFAWLAGLPATTLAWIRQRAPMLAAAVLCAVLLVLRRRRRGIGSKEVQAYRMAVRRSGLLPRPDETPRELLARAGRSELPATRLAALEQATVVHERARYRTEGAEPLASRT